MFKAQLDDVSLIRDSISTISELIDETELRVTQDGIKMIAADRAVVVVVNLFISKDVFSYFEYSKDASIGINLLNFLQILRRASSDDKLSIALKDGKLEMVLSGSSTRKFVLPLLDISKSETPDIKKLEEGFTSTFRINADILGSGIEDAELVTDSVVFTVRKDNFSMKAESDATSTQLDLPSGTEHLKPMNVGEPVRARYSLDYLKKIMKAKKLSDEAVMAIATDYPLKLAFDVPGKMKLGFILAPRVEE